MVQTNAETLRRSLEKGIRDMLRATAPELTFAKLEAVSAARELGLMEQIELNHPSKIEFEEIPVTIPDPKDSTRIIETSVRREKRVMMSDEEVVEHRRKEALEMALELLQADPERAKLFLDEMKGIQVPKATKQKKGGK